MNTKGFSLVELLAVITILAIIAIISAPIITGVIEDSRTSSFKSSLNGIKKAIETDYSDGGFDSNVTYSFGGYLAGEKDAAKSNKKLEVYKNGSKIRNVEMSGTVTGLGRGTVTASGSISLGIYTERYCGIVEGNTVNIYIFEDGSMTKNQCINKIDSL